MVGLLFKWPVKGGLYIKNQWLIGDRKQNKSVYIIVSVMFLCQTSSQAPILIDTCSTLMRQGGIGQPARACQVLSDTLTG